MRQEVTVYDFKKPQRYSTDNMRFLSLISEEFCKSINLFIAYELKRSNIVCKLEKTVQTNYEEFISTISKNSVIIEHAIQPLVQGLIFQLDRSVALSLVDLLLSGDGILENYNRPLTEIDRELVSHIADHLLKKMHIFEGCEYREVSNVSTNIGSSKKYPVSEAVLISHMTMMVGDKEIGRMSFCNPYSCMEPVLEQLESKRLFIKENKEYDFDFMSVLYNNINSANTDMVAILGITKMSVEELLKLELGDVITLDTKINGDIDLYVGGSKSFKCRPGLIKDKKGVVITNSIEI